MIPPIVPGPEETLATLAPLVPTLYHALEASVQDARAFFDERSADVDPFLFPCLVRYHAKNLLEEAGQQAEYELSELANNGLHLRFGPYQIRVLKSDNGRLPVPGPSTPRQRFYNQQLEFGFMGGSEVDMASTLLNLDVMWDVDGLMNLDRLTLVCPKAGTTTRDSVEQHWEIVIPHPAIVSSQSSGPSPADPSADGDLDISLKAERSRGGRRR